VKKLDDADITSKAVEISKCLVGAGPGMYTHDLGVTREVGDAARLAASIRRRGGTMTKETLAAVSTALKVDSSRTESGLLPLFQRLGWGEIKWKGAKVVGFEERVPPGEDILSTLGKSWWEMEPTSIDEASVKALSLLSKRPHSREAFASEIMLDNKELTRTLEYGEQARYLGHFNSQEVGEVMWTPLYWAYNSEGVQQFLEKQNDSGLQAIGHLAEELRRYPGRPKEEIDPSKSMMLRSGIWWGFFPTGKVTDRQRKTHEYVFASTPQFEADPKSDIFEKARMIVSCIRHGQYSAEVTKILYPSLLLQKMRTSQMKPHSYADVQYAILVLNGVVKLEPANTWFGKASRVVFIDTPENELAANMAAQMLRGDTPLATTMEEAEARKILTVGTYNYSAEQRKIRDTSSIAATDEFERLLENVRKT
jgi:hypothetical protein